MTKPTMIDEPVAVITGAAGSLGQAFCSELASRGYKLILIDINKQKLMQIANSTRPLDSAVADVITVDLTTEDGQKQVAGYISTLNRIDLLINNAGFGTHTLFAQSEIERQVAMVRLHIDATLRLCNAALPLMLRRGTGAIINVSSFGAWLRFPRDCTYIGTKCFLNAFSECLAIELRSTNITVQALCPTWLTTGFSPHAGDFDALGNQSPVPRFMQVTPVAVARSSIQALKNGSSTHIPTMTGKLLSLFLANRAAAKMIALLRAIRDLNR
jgi:short-subunit dehydrogenase